MSNFKLLVSTPFKRAFDGEAQSIQATDDNGEFEVLAQRGNAIFATVPSKVVVKDANGQELEWFSSGGLLEVRNGEVSLCVDTLETKDEIDLARAEASKQKHENVKKDGDYSQIDDMLNELSLSRAIGRIQYAKNHK